MSTTRDRNVTVAPLVRSSLGVVAMRRARLPAGPGGPGQPPPALASRPVRIAADATPLLGPRTGVGVFVAGALGALARRDDTEVVAYGLTARGRTSLREVLPEGVDGRWAVPAGLALRLWRHTRLVPVEWLVDLDGGVDVVHGTNYVLPPRRRAAGVVTVHDLTMVRYPELCAPASLRYPDLVRRAVAGGAFVHTPSQFVAGEVCEAFGIDPARVRAVAHGVGGPPAADHLADRAAARRLSGPGSYLLALGTVEPRKDFPLLVRAFDRVADHHPELRLVICGPNGWGAAALDAAVAEARHRARIVRTGYVSDELRAGLLAGATLLVSSARYEGFGFTPLEAMAAAVPVVATAAGAVPEVCGSAALLVPVGDAPALAEAVDEALGSPAITARLTAAGLARAADFSWERCAAGLRRLYGDAVSDRAG